MSYASVGVRGPNHRRGRDNVLKTIGCLTGTNAQWGRRDFVKVGSLGFLGMNLAQSLKLEAATLTRLSSKAKAKACILLWLEGGPAQMDTWDPKTNSSFRPISTKADGVQISELLPKLAKRMDKLALIRSMSSFGDDHPQAVHYTATGHLHNPAMQFPSVGSVVGKEMGSANGLPPYVIVPRWRVTCSIKSPSGQPSLGRTTTRC